MGGKKSQPQWPLVHAGANRGKKPESWLPFGSLGPGQGEGRNSALSFLCISLFIPRMSLLWATFIKLFRHSLYLSACSLAF